MANISREMSRRDFVAAAATAAAASHLPLGAVANQAAANGTVVLFQGDSITDAGRNRASADANSAGALGSGYPLLDASREALPHVHVIVLEPFVLRTGAVDARWFPEFDQRRAAAARVAARARATFVPLQTVFNQQARATPPEYWASDGVHPTPAGHAVIAEQWRRAAHLLSA